MTAEQLKEKILSKYPEVVFEEGGQFPVVNIESQAWIDIANWLRNENELLFDYLFCVTCVDWKTHMSMVYHLESKFHNHILVVKSKLDRENPVIATVSHIWRTAEFHEREAYDLFGVKFTNHPDLRRLFLTDEWKGWPLRKDYEDAVNMIKL
jgi:NADH:ubiquinone oxidoreductase subunit C